MIGLEINFSKSTLVSRNANDKWALHMAVELGYDIHLVLLKNLGVPINGGNTRTHNFWEPILKRIESRHSLWKCKLLLMAGRCLLIKVVLNNLPFHFLCMFRIPNNVTEKIISLQRNFFLGSMGDSWSLMKVKWDFIEALKGLGGLVIWNIHLKNFSLLSKWWWKFARGSDSLWKLVVLSAYNSTKQFQSLVEFGSSLEGSWQLGVRDFLGFVI